jgi:hypothetical protein
LIPELAAAELPDEVLAALRPCVTSLLDPASAFTRPTSGSWYWCGNNFNPAESPRVRAGR